MTFVAIILVLSNVALLAGACVYFAPRLIGGAAGNSLQQDADQAASLLSAIRTGLTQHATSLDQVNQTPESGQDGPSDQSVAELRQSNKVTGDAIDSNNKKLATVLSKYGDLYRTERRRIESYAKNVNELDELLQEFETDTDGSNQVLLRFVRDMVEENRQLQVKVSDCQQQVSELIARSVKSERDARTDALTQLPNRRAWEERLRELESDGPAAVALVDVDDFKLINDDCGHAAGDAMLTLIGTILRNTHEAVAYRIGGDEFAMLMPSGSEEQLAEKVRQKVAASKLNFAGEKLTTTVSIGTASREPGESFDDVLRRADDALYRAKESKGDRIRMAVVG